MRPKYSLRAFLCAVAVVAIPCGVIGTRIRQLAKEQDAAWNLEDNGFVVFTEPAEGFDQFVCKVAGVVLIDIDSRRVVGAAVTSDVSALQSEASIDQLKSFPRLHSLDLAECPNINDDDMEVVGSLKPLRDLVLDSTNITDTGVEKLRRLGSLKSINVANTGITIDGFRKLARLPRLEHIDIRGTSIAVTDVRSCNDEIRKPLFVMLSRGANVKFPLDSESN